jgi:transcription antitermination factor NusG
MLFHAILFYCWAAIFRGMAFTFKPGDRVRVTSGTFKSFEGVVQVADPGEVSLAPGSDSDAPVIVAISLFGRLVRAAILPELLESADLPRF